MSRIGKLPIAIPEGVTVTFTDSVVNVKGKEGELTQVIANEGISLDIADNEVSVKRASDEKEQRAAHGLYRSLISNMVEGVSKGFEIKQELVGVGYRASNKGNLLELSLGYSHNITFQLPEEIKVETETQKGQNPIITLKSYDKQLLGQVAAKIRSLRKPEPYKGKGIRFLGEEIRRKAGKAAGK